MYYPEIGGVEVVAQEIAKIGKEFYGNSVVITLNFKNEYVEENIDGIKIIRLPVFFRKDPIRLSKKFGKKLKEYSKKADKIVFHFPSGQPEMFFLFNDLEDTMAEKICFYHSDVVGRGILSKIYNRLFTIPFLKKMDKIITTSPNIVKSSHILRNFENKVEIVPLFVDLDHFSNKGNSKRRELIKEFDEKIKYIAMYIGRFGRYKGLEYFVETLKYLPKEFGIVLVGNGPERNKIIEKSKKLKLEKRITIKDHVKYEELPYYYSAADVFVLPSIDRGEAFGLVALEAMACGIPIVTTELGTGTTYHNINGVTGFHVPPKNSKALASAIRKICEENWKDNKKNIICKRAEEFSVENFRNEIKKTLKIN